MGSRSDRRGLLAAFPRISNRMARLITDGDTDGSYRSWTRQRGGTDASVSNHAWAMVSAIATHAGAQGWDRVQFRQVLLDTTAEAGKHAREIVRLRGRDRAAEWLDRAWDAAQEYRAASDGISSRQGAYAAVEALRAVIETLPWAGTAATTDLRNLSVRIGLCAKAGGFDHDVSRNQLAELMGCSRNAVQRSNERLAALGWIKVRRAATKTDPTVWLLMQGGIHHGPTPQSRQRGGVNPGGSIVNNPRSQASKGDGADLDSRTVEALTAEDAFAHLGLGGATLKVVAALAERPGQSAAELCATASASQPTVSRATRKLAALGLAAKTGETWSLTPNALEGAGTREGDEQPGQDVPLPQDWDDVAKAVGTHGTGARRKAAHEAQRRAWDEFRARAAENRRAATAPAADPRRVEPGLVNADGHAVDPATGQILDGWHMAADGEWIWHDPHPDGHAAAN